MEDFDYEKYKESKIQNAINDKLDENIFLKQDKVIINKKFYQVKNNKNKNDPGQIDDRFKKMFTDKDFQMDQNHKK